MAPSTDAVMGAAPEEKAGVGSAMNGVSRMVAGALGAAISHQPSATGQFCLSRLFPSLMYNEQ